MYPWLGFFIFLQILHYPLNMCFSWFQFTKFARNLLCTSILLSGLILSKICTFPITMKERECITFLEAMAKWSCRPLFLWNSVCLVVWKTSYQHHHNRHLHHVQEATDNAQPYSSHHSFAPSPWMAFGGSTSATTSGPSLNNRKQLNTQEHTRTRKHIIHADHDFKIAGRNGGGYALILMGDVMRPSA